MPLKLFHICFLLCALVFNQSAVALPHACQAEKTDVTNTAAPSNHHQNTRHHEQMDHHPMNHDNMSMGEVAPFNTSVSCCDDCQCDINTCQNHAMSLSSVAVPAYNGKHIQTFNNTAWLNDQHPENPLKPPTYS